MQPITCDSCGLFSKVNHLARSALVAATSEKSESEVVTCRGVSKNQKNGSR